MTRQYTSLSFRPFLKPGIFYFKDYASGKINDRLLEVV